MEGCGHKKMSNRPQASWDVLNEKTPAEEEPSFSILCCPALLLLLLFKLDLIRNRDQFLP